MLDALLLSSQWVFPFVAVGISRGSSRGRGKGGEGNSHCVRGFSWSRFLWGSSLWEVPSWEQKWFHQRGTTERIRWTERRVAKMHAWWWLPSANVHQGNRWWSSFLQMPASMGNCYYYLFLQYVPLLYSLHDILIAVFLGRRKLWVH